MFMKRITSYNTNNNNNVLQPWNYNQKLSNGGYNL